METPAMLFGLEQRLSSICLSITPSFYASWIMHLFAQAKVGASVDGMLLSNVVKSTLK